MLEKKENLAINLGKIREEGYFFFHLDHEKNRKAVPIASPYM